MLYFCVFFNVCFFLSPKRGAIAVAIWNLITSFIALTCFAALSGTAKQELIMYTYEDKISVFESNTPLRMKMAAVAFAFVFLLNVMLLWASIKEMPKPFLPIWMIGNLVLEISILIFAFEWPPSYNIPKALWFFRFGLAMCFLRTVYVYYKFLADPNPPTTLVNIQQPDGTIKQAVATINKV